MPAITTTRDYSDGAALTEAHLDAAFDSWETALNSTKLDSTNIQNGGIATANYAALSVDSAALAASAVTTAKIAANAVTRAKLAEVGHQVSSASGSQVLGAVLANITDLEVTLTTTGRPVILFLVPDGGGTETAIVESGGADATVQFAWTCDGTVIARFGAFVASTKRESAPSLVYIHTPAAGSHTYRLQGTRNTGSVTIANFKIAAYEL